MPLPFACRHLIYAATFGFRLSALGTIILCGILTAPATFAGSGVTYDSKQSSTDYSIQEPVVEVPIARASRGNITLEGPSGMFLNPTSATLPQGTFASGYCAVLTNQD